MAPALARRGLVDLKAERVRQLLNNYYGSEPTDSQDTAQASEKSETTSPSGKSAPARASGATDLDSKDFSVDK